MKLWYGNIPQCIQTKVVRMKGMYIFEVRVVDQNTVEINSVRIISTRSKLSGTQQSIY